MKRIIKWFLVISSGVLFLAFIWLCWAWSQSEARARAFQSVQRGDSEAHVLQLLGKPLKVTGSPLNIAWDSENLQPNKGQCIQEFWYAPKLQIAGEEWTLGFDAQSNVVSKYRYQSP